MIVEELDINGIQTVAQIPNETHIDVSDPNCTLEVGYKLTNRGVVCIVKKNCNCGSPICEEVKRFRDRPTTKRKSQGQSRYFLKRQKWSKKQLEEYFRNGLKEPKPK